MLKKIQYLKRLPRSWLISCIAGFLGCIGGFIAIKDSTDDRVVVEDFVVGAPYEIVEVDGSPVERVKHGIIVTRVPYALIEPGKHTLTITQIDDPTNEPIKVDVEILEGFRYRLDKTEEGSPSIVAFFD